MKDPSGREIDVTSFIHQITIKEAMTKTFIECKLEILDTEGFKEKFTLTGVETYFIEINTFGGGENLLPVLEFRSTEMVPEEKFEDARGGGYIFAIYTTSVEFIRNIETRIRKSYIRKTTSDIVRNVYTNILQTEKALNIQNTKYIQNITVPGWSPRDTLKKMAEWSIPQQADGSGALFWCYETMLGGFNFVSQEKLIQNSTTLYEPVTYYIRPKNFNPGNKLETDSMMERDSMTVNNWELTRFTNIVENTLSGFNSSVLETYDINTFNRREQFYTYNPIIDNTQTGKRVIQDNFTHMESGSFTQTNEPIYNPEARRFFYPSSSGQSEAIGISEPTLGNHPEEFIQQRYAQMQGINNFQMRLSVPGNTDRFAGEVILLDLPSYQVLDDNNQKQVNLDEYHSGKFMIIDVAHVFGQAHGYQTIINIAKDSLKNVIPETVTG